MKLSVLMSVYHRESAEYFGQALESLAAQTVPADEVVIVKDGPVNGELDAAIERHREQLRVLTVPLPNNGGLGPALNAGLRECSGELVARMDTDDICAPDRFEKQLAFLEQNPGADVVGGAIAEFDTDYRNVESIRRMPSSAERVGRIARWRNPLNHMTVMFRKAAVLAAGSYQPCPGFEDYDLWATMLMRGMKLCNLEDVLVYVRCGNGMHKRRGGIPYLQQEAALQYHFLEMGFVSKPRFLLNLAMRAPVRIAPVSLRALFYRSVLRQS